MKLRPELLNVVCNMDILSHSEGKRKRDRRKGEREREKEKIINGKVGGGGEEIKNAFFRLVH